MTRRLTYKYVKEYIESFGYTLLSEEYINSSTKLKVMCPHGHVYEVTFDKFKQGRRCKKCNINKRANNKRLTQEFVEKECAKRGYTLIGEYVNNSTKLILQDEEGYLYVTTWNNFSKEHEPEKFSSYNPYTIQNIKLWMRTNTIGYKLLSTEYVNSDKDKLLFKCPLDHQFEMCWSHFQNGERCSVCAGKQVTPETCIATTDTWMVKYFKNKEDAYTHHNGSVDKVSVVCPICGKEKEMIILNLYKYKSIGCNNCGDGTSYSEKFTISMLNQLNIKYIREYSPKWSNKKRYDFYLENYNCIIECHGKQHYNCDFSYCGGRSLEEEQENDKYKRQLAKQNDIKYYIVLDCSKSELEYIKNSILNSELNDIFDLTNIDWIQCEEFALKNRIKEVCNYWREHNEVNNEDLTTTDIGKIFNLSRGTIVIYLKQGTELGWCYYNNEYEIIKNNKKNSKPVEILKNDVSLGIFESCRELDRQSEELFGVKLFHSIIGTVCRGKKSQYKDFTFRYITKEEYELRKNNPETVDRMIS